MSYRILSAMNNTVDLKANYFKHVTFLSDAEMAIMYAPIIMLTETSYCLPAICGRDNR